MVKAFFRDRNTVLTVAVVVLGVLFLIGVALMPRKKIEEQPGANNAAAAGLRSRVEHIETLRTVLDDPVFQRLPSDLEKFRSESH